MTEKEIEQHHREDRSVSELLIGDVIWEWSKKATSSDRKKEKKWWWKKKSWGLGCLMVSSAQENEGKVHWFESETWDSSSFLSLPSCTVSTHHLVLLLLPPKCIHNRATLSISSATIAAQATTGPRLALGKSFPAVLPTSSINPQFILHTSGRERERFQKWNWLQLPHGPWNIVKMSCSAKTVLDHLVQLSFQPNHVSFSHPLSTPDMLTFFPVFKLVMFLISQALLQATYPHWNARSWLFHVLMSV